MRFTDSLLREIDIKYPPQKIISLVPSITELLFKLLDKNKILAVTPFCKHLLEVHKKPKIGGPKTPEIKKINDLNPDLIIAEKNENEKKSVLLLAEKNPVYVFKVENFNSAIKMIIKIGELVNKKASARIITDKIINKFINLKIDFKRKTVFYPVWKNPYITINKNTYINSILEICNLKNIFAEKQENYPAITKYELNKIKPDYIFLPSEPYNFKDKDINSFQKKFPQTKTLKVNGQMFTWYGLRMLYAADYLKQLHKKLI